MDMTPWYTGSVHLHNGLRWLLLVLLVYGIFRHVMAWQQKKYYDIHDLKRNTWLMSTAHFMLVLGMFQWVVGPWGLKNIQNLGGMGAAMKDSVARFWAVEHLTGMFIAIILITIGRGFGKKGISDQMKHKKTFTFFIIALLVIIAVMPWPFRAGIGRPWFPGMH